MKSNSKGFFQYLVVQRELDQIVQNFYENRLTSISKKKYARLGSWMIKKHENGEEMFCLELMSGDVALMNLWVSFNEMFKQI